MDPGISGAIAFLRCKDLKLQVRHMPKRKRIGAHHGRSKRHEIDGQLLADVVRNFVRVYRGSIRCVVELVGARLYTNGFGQLRGQGAAASFEFGKSTGVVHGIMAGFSIPVTATSPGVWKSLLNLSSDKNLSRKRASELFPLYADTFEKVTADGLAEAALLAWLGYKAFYLEQINWRNDERANDVSIRVDQDEG